MLFSSTWSVSVAFLGLESLLSEYVTIIRMAHGGFYLPHKYVTSSRLIR